mmetsp:Transcript_2262/g.3297  ORF Transcript_2262/g.3297 Transcript_2262/m.3297 type:complete len:218 (+) Transcript_2262:2395-3048(+)|eukprot:CAMPEP_0203748340 /NCGR_PEP_ID=MMETSP0098-20131031/3257_1 /ASSEMBLY_ACC=CAM_ASM_000208 /TAXON_ID=96639 /ORGANISM=" , Strain NY0313808BC1" /LENGTH=217 /DNA_ID=CAMNT_0050637059 /DNA_START=439 /DNA_END=1092 /DNA_ORIENTATION=+
MCLQWMMELLSRALGENQVHEGGDDMEYTSVRVGEHFDEDDDAPNTDGDDEWSGSDGWNDDDDVKVEVQPKSVAGKAGFQQAGHVEMQRVNGAVLGGVVGSNGSLQQDRKGSNGSLNLGSSGSIKYDRQSSAGSLNLGSSRSIIEPITPPPAKEVDLFQELGMEPTTFGQKKHQVDVADEMHALDAGIDMDFDTGAWDEGDDGDQLDIDDLDDFLGS